MKYLLILLLFLLGCGGGSAERIPQGPVIESDTDGYRAGEYKEISEEQERIYEENYKNYHGPPSPSSYYGAMKFEVDELTVSPPNNRYDTGYRRVYNFNTGETEAVYEMYRSPDYDRPPSLLNPSTGTVYVPMSTGDLYIGGGNMIRPY